jgi:hypothetical protein
MNGENPGLAATHQFFQEQITPNVKALDTISRRAKLNLTRLPTEFQHEDQVVLNNVIAEPGATWCSESAMLQTQNDQAMARACATSPGASACSGTDCEVAFCTALHDKSSRSPAIA